MEDLAAVTFGYLVGSVPFAFLLARRKGIDLRRIGSGNVGATNVLRTSGTRAAIAAMCLDAAKGCVAVVMAQRLAPGLSTPVAAGLAAMLGHVYPVFLGFRGGRGVATAAGAFGVLAPLALLTASAVFVVTVWCTRYISAGSMAGAVALATTVAMMDVAPVVAPGAAVAAGLIVYWHRHNLARLIQGTEHRVGQRLP